PLAFGSDGMPPGPLYGLRGAITPPHPLQRLPPQEAIRAYTVGGAYSLFTEEEFGEIAPGKAADLVVLSGDPRREPLGGIRVELTLLGGKIIFQRCG
ncbi:amidohydrolase family protein, partial [Candidatus Bipolaricaulota bacterium]|nr:amidohydrolase family protein [Candidatus Bipolaricaulota bacterium]